VPVPRESRRRFTLAGSRSAVAVGARWFREHGGMPTVSQASAGSRSWRTGRCVPSANWLAAQPLGAHALQLGAEDGEADDLAIGQVGSGRSAPAVGSIVVGAWSVAGGLDGGVGLDWLRVHQRWPFRSIPGSGWLSSLVGASTPLARRARSRARNTRAIKDATRRRRNRGGVTPSGDNAQTGTATGGKVDQDADNKAAVDQANSQIGVAIGGSVDQDASNSAHVDQDNAQTGTATGGKVDQDAANRVKVQQSNDQIGVSIGGSVNQSASNDASFGQSNSQTGTSTN
jgi:hypothetical protein